ncbi:DUF4129 domain-containing protein [Actinoplanes sp. NPDC049265]|uniref:DUF4129 domain-containing protein n=1 Tax=Actinoplanes sp. NPDC049265 TaxID=3363902 RepID=UPI0037126475
MDLARLRRWWPLAAVIGLLFLASVAATRSLPQLERIRPAGQAEDEAPLLPTEPLRPPPPTADGSGTPPPTDAGLPPWLTTAALVVLGVAALVLIGLVVWAILRDQARRRGRRPMPERDRTDPNTAEDLVAALDAGLEELSDADRDPRRAVIACWVRLEQAAAAAGTPRHAGDSPTDLVGRLLREQQVDAGVLAALLEVYRQARYATHTVDDQMRAQARLALERLRADLGAPQAAS